jgi:transcriptional regulator with XRE-family HTH domain
VEQLDLRTVYAFAKALKKSQSGVKEWLRKDGENTIPDAPALIRLAREFRLDLNWLLTGEGTGESRLKNG